eukprot:2681503-Pleurochrysis_carterae.AAC.1
MAATGLRWERVTSAPARRTAAGATEARPRLAVPAAWLAAGGTTPRETRRRATQLRMLGLASSDGVIDVTQRALA